jgi:hypothetical protein
MPNHFPHLELTNPFCAARLRPGTIGFVFEHGKSLEQLVDTLEANAWHGQITGGHGTGKSTLLAALTHAIERRGRLVKSITLEAGQRILPREFLRSLCTSRNCGAAVPAAQGWRDARTRTSAGLGVAAVDGFEQLNLWNRLVLKRFCRTHGVGLVVASHRSAHLPSLYETVVDEARAWRVIQQLQNGFPPRINTGDLVERLTRHKGNLREALFDLYDLYEERA